MALQIPAAVSSLDRLKLTLASFVFLNKPPVIGTSKPIIFVAHDHPFSNPDAVIQYLSGSMDIERQILLHHWSSFGSKANVSLDKEVIKVLTKGQLFSTGKKITALDLVVFSTLRMNEKEVKEAKVKEWMASVSKEKGVCDALDWIQQQEAKANRPRVQKLKGDVAIEPKPKGIRLPKKGERNVLITSALPYVNNVPHLGNIIGCVLSADVFARYCRMKGYNTLYICGTDEYGTATETKALEEKVSCQALCDKYHKLHAEIYKWFQVDFDHFGRTTTPAHTKIAQDIFLNLHSKNLLLTESMSQLFCEKCQRFLADRYVEGICPLCKYPDARGDQCDGCGKLLNATDLISPRCKLDGTPPIVRESNHMFLNLPELQEACEAFVAKNSENGFWTSNGKHITATWLKEGLKPRCITRDLKWGTPVPLESMKEKVLYVWFDAPIGYLSITANYTSEWEKWWKNPEDVKLYQFMGKDNVPFHTVIFPCTLLGTKEPWTMLHHLSTTEYLNYEGDKFSKSRGIGVFGNNVMESGIPVSVWRYYLLASRPESNDSVFTWNELMLRNNSELLANLGNFVNRTLKFLSAKFDGFVPAMSGNERDLQLIDNINGLLVQYNESMESVKLRQALKLIMDISSLGNQYLQDNKLDNTLFEQHYDRCSTVMNVGVNLIYILSALLYPFMPDTAESICKQLNAPLRKIPDCFDTTILEGHAIGKPEHLFKRIDEKTIEALFMKYGGEQILKKRAAATAAPPKKQ